MQYLSIYQSDEYKEFLYAKDFINKEDYENEMFDGLLMFEGDPDYIDIRQENGMYKRIYFAVFHPDWKWQGERVCLTTAEYDDETEAVRQYLENKAEFEVYECQNWNTMEQDRESRYKVAYRGGQGYSYTLSYCAY